MASVSSSHLREGQAVLYMDAQLLIQTFLFGKPFKFRHYFRI
jgi:hypothetical protein